MKRWLVVAAMAAVTASANAADLHGKVTVLEGKNVVMVSENKFVGLTDEEVAKLTKSAAAQLNFASQHQDKGGNYTMVWEWVGQPAVETQGMRLGAVIKTLRRGTWWLAEVVDHADANERKGNRQWGHGK